MKRILVIDDMRVFTPEEGEEIVTVRTAEEGWYAIGRSAGESPERWDEVWLDHDLGHDEYGRELTIRWLVESIEETEWLGRNAHRIRWTGPDGRKVGHYEGEPLDESSFNIGMFVIITDNPVGREWMIAALSRYYPVEVGKREYRIDWKETPA